MPTDASTKDCTALDDSELAEMADLESDRSGFDIGFLSKEREEWVLATTVRDGKKLKAYGLFTLERIGGTPSLLIGVACVDRSSRADTALRTMMADQFRRAVLAFPDEDVLLGVRLFSPHGFRVFSGLSDVVPTHGVRATGEDRAWGRRLAKRFGAESRLDDRTFVLKGNGSNPAGGLDFVHDGVKVPEGAEGFFGALDPVKGDRLVAFGWAMAEDLAAGKLPR